MDFEKIAKEVLQIEAQELQNGADNINDSISKAVKLIANTKGKLIVTGVGKSGLVGAKIAATLASTGTSSFFLHPTEAMHGDLGMIGATDSVLAISYSGESSELIQILPHLKRLSIPMVAMANNPNSTLALSSNVFIDISINKEACPLDTAPTSSTTLTMAMGDALAVCLMKNAKFNKSDFASFHPGGSLGKKLFIKVDDLMQTKNLPIVKLNTTLKDAVVIMSEGRLGNAIILNNDNTLAGLLSDGDLRRYMMKDGFCLDTKVQDIATLNPKYIDDKNLLASDALKITEENKIQLLIVLNKNKTLHGVLHIHTLVEAGIK
jgi:arabinose-5-phosphate isomerase